MDGLIGMLQCATERTPEAVALIEGQRRTRYRELWDRVLALGAAMRDQGIVPGERVALQIPNSAEYVIVYYATLAIGAVAVPLNPEATVRESAGWLRHSGARRLFTDRADTPAESDVALVRIGSPEWQRMLVHTPLEQLPPVPPEAPATIVYTSGTTGRPKGVTLSRRNLAANVESILGYLPIGPDDRGLNVLPFHYSYGNSVLHTHLVAGAALVLEEGMGYPVRIAEALERERITGFFGVPSTFALLLKRVTLERFDLSSVRYLTQAGGPMPPADTRRLVEAFPSARLFVMYGQTEATARLSWLPPEALEEKLGSIGIPIPGVELSLRDEAGTPVPQGMEGEIWARGENVMLGYWRDPAASAQVLWNGWLRTGDLARQDGDGFFYIVGRRSEMIKSGAHRIAPKEIEEVIAELDEVAECAVVGEPDPILGQIIKAVVVARPGFHIDPVAIRRHCRAALAAHKVPRRIERAEALPRTASGKLRRFLLTGNGEEYSHENEVIDAR